MAICILLVILWVLYSFALVIFLGYLSELPPTPLFEINSLGLCSGFVLAVFGWIAYTVFAATYIFGG
jgi:hypothetical protein